MVMPHISPWKNQKKINEVKSNERKRKKTTEKAGDQGQPSDGLPSGAMGSHGRMGEQGPGPGGGQDRPGKMRRGEVMSMYIDSLVNYIRELEEQKSQIEMVSGMKLDELLDKFMQGYTMHKEEPTRMPESLEAIDTHRVSRIFGVLDEMSKEQQKRMIAVLIFKYYP